MLRARTCPVSADPDTSGYGSQSRDELVRELARTAPEEARGVIARIVYIRLGPFRPAEARPAPGGPGPATSRRRQRPTRARISPAISRGSSSAMK